MGRLGQIASIVSLATLGGCGFLQDWGNFTVGGEDAGPMDAGRDAGPGMDAGADAGPGTDAGPGEDAGPIDSGPDAGLTCAENPVPSSDLGRRVFVGATLAASHRLTPSCRSGTAPDRQYLWRAPADGTYRFTTEGSNYDTVLSIQGTCDGMELACDDDSPVTGEQWSDLTVVLTMGQTVVVNVDGFSGGTGDFQVNVGRGACGDGTVNLDLEACDDGNTTNRDGCSGSCAIEEVDGALRIVDGPDASQGRLEVYFMGEWGTVCDDPEAGTGWDSPAVNAGVACRQLGFSTGDTVPSPMTPDGTGTIGLDDVVCMAGATRLMDCDCGASCAMASDVCTLRWACDNCTHLEDVGVDCTP